jgi:hypothetical protein
MAFGEPQPRMSAAAAKKKSFSPADESRQTFVGWKAARLSVGLGTPAQVGRGGQEPRSTRLPKKSSAFVTGFP